MAGDGGHRSPADTALAWAWKLLLAAVLITVAVHLVEAVWVALVVIGGLLIVGWVLVRVVLTRTRGW